MLKIPRRASAIISLTLTIIFMLALITAAVIMPKLSQMLTDTHDNIGDSAGVTDTGRALILTLSYLIIAVAAAADIFLFLLLMRVRHGLVFTDKSVALVRAVSWCCVLIGLFFCLLGRWFQLSFGVGFAALFVGICLRVVKNVIEEATAIKSENDLTI